MTPVLLFFWLFPGTVRVIPDADQHLMGRARPVRHRELLQPLRRRLRIASCVLGPDGEVLGVTARQDGHRWAHGSLRIRAQGAGDTDQR